MRQANDLEERRKMINRRISLISATLFLLAGTIGAFVLGDRISDQTRYGLIVVTALWFGYRILRLRRAKHDASGRNSPMAPEDPQSDHRESSSV